MGILEEQNWLDQVGRGGLGFYYAVYFWYKYPKLFGSANDPFIGFGGLARNCYVFVLGL